MVLHCDHCNYDFEDKKTVPQCPECGKMGGVRLATMREAGEYQDRKQEGMAIWTNPVPVAV